VTRRSCAIWLIPWPRANRSAACSRSSSRRRCPAGAYPPAAHTAYRHTCANWLRYGIEPKNPRPGLVPGACKDKAHRRDHLAYAGRRVLVSRKWSGKTLADHRADRKEWLTAMLGLPATDPTPYRWEQVQPHDEDYLPPARRLLHAVADRLRWQNALTEARRRAQDALDAEVSAIRRAA
jgi:hypothetical protein